MNRQHSVRRQIVSHAETVNDMSARVLNTEGEPTYALEKLGRAFRETVSALSLLGWTRSDFAKAIDRQVAR